MTGTHPVARVPADLEKRELEALLASGVLHRAQNLHSFLQYVCQKYFEGNLAELKEYNIAVAALHRGHTFNPQSDTIVRVTAHALRRRLEQYYREDGAHHAVHIILPSGTYCPRFVWSGEPELEPELENSSSSSELKLLPPSQEAHVPPVVPKRTYRWPITVAALALAATCSLFVYTQYTKNQRASDSHANLTPAIPMPAAAANASIRFLPGVKRAALVDTAGQTWGPDSFCTGGSSFSHPKETVNGIDDPDLLTSGRSGKSHCVIPAESGDYELHLFFADTFHGQEATRQVGYSVNGAHADTLDVADEAGGANVMTERVVPDVQPAADGKVHLDFVTDDSFVNAVELIPATRGTMLPLRIVAGRAAFHDQQRHLWLSDRFFSGGRRTYHADGLPSVPDPGLFQYERFGHFQYWLPVIPGREYKLNLYFEESWYGTKAGGPGGAGSRVFDVYCNGTTLLSHFDILEKNPSAFAIATFHHLKPTAQGKLELFFTPITNYPLVDALEVEQEPEAKQE